VDEAREHALIKHLHIGLDLDNTIISYDRAFVEVGTEIGLLPADHGLRTKNAVKSFLCGRPGGKAAWMRLQGQIYGLYIDSGILWDGVPEFLRAVHQAGAKVSIVSHKTKYGHFDASRVNLWHAAIGWLERRGLFSVDLGLDRENIHFLETREEKIMMIAKIGCHVFIDDLPEVLLDPSFPRQTTGIWFASGQNDKVGRGLAPHHDWKTILQVIQGLAPCRRGKCTGAMSQLNP
jgi:hypothetical protein